MLDLSTPKAPFDIALPYGLLVTVKPLTTAGMAAAQAAAMRAVEAIANYAGPPLARTKEELHERPSLSVKLSALHPRYQPSQENLLKTELLPRLLNLAQAMREAWLPLTVDAEEADKLDLSLALVEPLFTDSTLAGWDGLGLAVQAYIKRALPLIDWLACLAKATVTVLSPGGGLTLER